MSEEGHPPWRTDQIIADALQQIAKNTTPPEIQNNAALKAAHAFYRNELLDIMNDLDADTLKKFKAIRDLIGKSAKYLEDLSNDGNS